MTNLAVLQNHVRSEANRLKAIPPFKMVKIGGLSVAVAPGMSGKPSNYKSWTKMLVSAPVGTTITIKNAQYRRYDTPTEMHWGFRYFCQFLAILKVSYTSKREGNYHHFTIIKNPWLGHAIHSSQLLDLLKCATFTSRYRVRLAKLLSKLVSEDSRMSLLIRLIMDAKCSSNEEVENELFEATKALEEQLGLDISKLHNLSIARTWKRGRKPRKPLEDNITNK